MLRVLAWLYLKFCFLFTHFEENKGREALPFYRPAKTLLCAELLYQSDKPLAGRGSCAPHLSPHHSWMQAWTLLVVYAPPVVMQVRFWGSSRKDPTKSPFIKAPWSSYSVLKRYLGRILRFLSFIFFPSLLSGVTRMIALRCRNLDISVVNAQLVWHFLEHHRWLCMLRRQEVSQKC